jgi:hypothetical protein
LKALVHLSSLSADDLRQGAQDGGFYQPSRLICLGVYPHGWSLAAAADPSCSSSAGLI